MQLLFIFILIYYSDFILLQNISNEVQFGKFHTNVMYKCNASSTHEVKHDELVTQRRIQEASKQFFDRHSFNVQTRKLLGYPSKPLYQEPTKRVRTYDSSVQFHKEEQRDILREIEKSTENHIVWDDWGNWSPCSVTCGNGRQVRWRHCSGGNCSKGLKKAQIKTCRLKPCESKNILNWLGLKSR